MYPPSTALEWDSPGLTCGDLTAEVRAIHFAVDPTIAVAREAVRANADLLVTHHPLFLRGAHSVSTESAKGELIHRLIRARVGLFSAHTNADDARPGVSDALARTLGLSDLRPLRARGPRPATDVLVAATMPPQVVDRVVDAVAAVGGAEVGEYRRCAFTVAGVGTFEPSQHANPAIGRPGQRESTAEMRVEFSAPRALLQEVVAALRSRHPYEEPVIWISELVDPAAADAAAALGTGRVGRLPEPISLERFALHVAQSLPFSPQGVRIAGPPDELVETVAVCGGAGDSLFEDARASGADVYLTADLRHHPVSEAREQAREGKPYLIDVSHWSSEWPWLYGCASRLQTTMLEQGVSVEVRVSEIRTDPWTFRVPSSGGIVR